RALRDEPAAAAETAIIGVTPAAGAREQRLEWLRAGAWDCLGFPLLAEEVLLSWAARCVRSTRPIARGRRRSWTRRRGCTRRADCGGGCARWWPKRRGCAFPWRAWRSAPTAAIPGCAGAWRGRCGPTRGSRT